METTVPILLLFTTDVGTYRADLGMCVCLCRFVWTVFLQRALLLASELVGAPSAFL